MPPKQRYTKEQIISVATQLVQSEGMQALTARALGERLHCSVAPIFSLFDNMEELRAAVIIEAKKMYGGYIAAGLKQSLPFKGAGLKYIQFAKDEPQLFKLLFMSDYNVNVGNFLLLDENNSKILNALMTTWGLDEKTARALHEDILIYTHGIASLCATGSCSFTDEEISKRLTAAFTAMLKEVKSK